MSFQNRDEDFQRALKLNIGESFEFHMFQEMGAMIKKVGDDFFELYDVKWDRDLLDSTYTSETLMGAINMVYETWN